MKEQEKIPNQVKRYISENKTSDAISLLLEAAKENKKLSHALQVVLSEYNDLVSKKIKGTLTSEQETLRLNNIHDRILLCLSVFDKNGDLLPTAKVPKINKAKTVLLRLGLTLFLIGAILVISMIWLEEEGLLRTFNWMIILGFIGYFTAIGGLVSLGGWFIVTVIDGIQKG